MGARPPRFVLLALAGARMYMVLALGLLGLAVWTEGPSVTSTNNYYHDILGVPHITFPVLCWLAMLVIITASVVFRKNTFPQALAYALAGLPLVMYCAAAIFFVYRVLENRTLVTLAMYMTAWFGYYAALVLSLAVGLWEEYLRLNGRTHE